MTEQEDNELLARFAGFTLYQSLPEKWQDADGWIGSLPDFLHSLDAQAKWLWPKLRRDFGDKLGEISFDTENDKELCMIIHWTGKHEEDRYGCMVESAHADTPRRSLCRGDTSIGEGGAMILTKKEVYGGRMMPRGYGLAYQEFDRMVYIVYPIPLNLIIRLAHGIYWRLAQGIAPLYFESQVSKQSSANYKDAYNQGYNAGKIDGYKESTDNLLEGLRKPYSDNLSDQ